MKYPIPAVRVTVDKKVVLDRLKGGETWVEALRRSVREQTGRSVTSEKFLGMGDPLERDGEWWLPADFSIND